MCVIIPTDILTCISCIHFFFSQLYSNLLGYDRPVFLTSSSPVRLLKKKSSTSPWQPQEEWKHLKCRILSCPGNGAPSQFITICQMSESKQVKCALFPFQHLQQFLRDRKTTYRPTRSYGKVHSCHIKCVCEDVQTWDGLTKSYRGTVPVFMFVTLQNL